MKFLVCYPGDVMQVIREKFCLKSESLGASVRERRGQAEEGERGREKGKRARRRKESK